MKKKAALVIILVSFIIFVVFALNKGEKKGCFPNQDSIIDVAVDQKKDDQLHIIVIGDSGGETQEYQQNQRAVARAISEHCDNALCDMVLLLGDNFYPNGVKSASDQRFVSSFERVYENIALPFFSVLGNHDVNLNAQAQIDYSLLSDRWKMPNFYYQFEVGNASFNAINSNCDIYSWIQQLFLDTGAGEEKTWRVSFAHHPIYSSGSHGDANVFIRALWEWFYKDDVDIYLAGHNHLLEMVSNQANDDQTIYAISGSASKFYKSEEEQARSKMTDAKSEFLHHGLGFLKLSLFADQAQFRFFDEQGEQLFAFTQNKQ